jgi:hypothetical protein
VDDVASGGATSLSPMNSTNGKVAETAAMEHSTIILRTRRNPLHQQVVDPETVLLARRKSAKK